jgi:hypothetical protein
LLAVNARSFRADWRAWWRELEDHQELRRRLERLASQPPLSPSAPLLREPVDVVVTTNEMNDRHGTGVLVKRVFEGRRGLFSIRARNDYGGEHDFGDAAVVVAHGGGERATAFGRVLGALRGRTVRRIVCVPYAADDLLTSIALAELFRAPLCAWIMDDYNVGTGGIPDVLMHEFLSKCTLRLATHSELREAYERKYRLPFSILPAVVTEEFVTTEVALPDGPEVAAGTGTLVGSFWSQRWFDRMCDLLAASGHATHWFGNHRSPYFRFPPDRLAAARLEPRGIVPERELAPLLRRYPYCVVPTGTLDAEDDASHTALLSLPGRILFAAATAHVPQIVVGSPETSAARVVTRLGIGIVSPFEPDAYRRAVAQVLEPEAQLRMRRNAAAIAPALSSKGVGEWLYSSIERGAAADERFERVFPRLSPVPERA